MDYDTFIFDLDGTLVHTSPEYRYLVVGKTLKDLGRESHLHYIDRFWFEAGREMIIQEYFRLEPSLFWEKYNGYDTMEFRSQHTIVYDDVDFVKELKNKGFKTGIVTGAPLRIASFEIGLLGENYFDGIVIANTSQGIKPKPHPHGLVECLNLIGSSKERAVYIGNADEDVEAAKKAGVLDCLIDRDEYDFSHINSSLRISSLYELRKLIEKM